MTTALNRELPVMPAMKSFTIKIPKRLVHLLLFTNRDEQTCDDERNLSPSKRKPILEQHSDNQHPHHHQEMDQRPVSDLKSPRSSSPAWSEHDTPIPTRRRRKRIRFHDPPQEDNMGAGSSSAPSGPLRVSLDPREDVDGSPVIQRRKRFEQRPKRRKQRLKQQSIATMFAMQTSHLKAGDSFQSY
jgi:hypothetical protein